MKTWWDEKNVKEHSTMRSRRRCLEDELAKSDKDCSRGGWWWWVWNGGVAACCATVLGGFEINNRLEACWSSFVSLGTSHNGVGSSALLISLVPLLLALISAADAAISCRFVNLHRGSMCVLLCHFPLLPRPKSFILVKWHNHYGQSAYMQVCVGLLEQVDGYKPLVLVFWWSVTHQETGTCHASHTSVSSLMCNRGSGLLHHIHHGGKL